jgi:hypothetical protein
MRARNSRKGMAKSVFYVVRAIPIARQRVAKHIPAINEYATIGYLLLGNEDVNTMFSVWSVPRRCKGRDKARRSSNTTENENGACPSDL